VMHVEAIVEVIAEEDLDAAVVVEVEVSAVALANKSQHDGQRFEILVNLIATLTLAPSFSILRRQLTQQFFSLFSFHSLPRLVFVLCASRYQAIVLLSVTMCTNQSLPMLLLART